jgi:hypothetical protein
VVPERHGNPTWYRNVTRNVIYNDAAAELKAQLEEGIMKGSLHETNAPNKNNSPGPPPKSTRKHPKAGARNVTKLYKLKTGRDTDYRHG